MLRSQGAANAGASSPTRCALLPVRRDRSPMPHDRKPCTSMLVAWQCMLYVQMRDSFASRDCLRCEHSTIQSWRAHFSSQFYYRQCLVNGSRRWLTSASKILELATGCHAASTDTLIRVDGWPQMCSEVMSLNGHVLTGSKQILVNPIQRAVCNM